MKLCYDSYYIAVFVDADFIFGYWYCVEVDCCWHFGGTFILQVEAECVPEIFATHPLSRATNTKVGSASLLNPHKNLKSLSSTYTLTLAGLMTFMNTATVDCTLNV
jgi:hypothetical protein